MNGLPSENIDELDRRLTAVEEFIASNQKPVQEERTEPEPVRVFVDKVQTAVQTAEGPDNAEE